MFLETPLLLQAVPEMPLLLPKSDNERQLPFVCVVAAGRGFIKMTAPMLLVF